MLSSSGGVDDDDTVDTAGSPPNQSPLNEVEDASVNPLDYTATSFASPPSLLVYQSPEPLTMENIFRELAFSAVPSADEPILDCSAQVNAVICDMMDSTTITIPTVLPPPPNGVFTLFGSSIVLPSTNALNIPPCRFQFHDKPDLLPTVESPNFQSNSISHLPQPFTSDPLLTEPLTFTGPPPMIEPLTSMPSFPAPVTARPPSPSGLPPGSHLQVVMYQRSRLSGREARASGSRALGPLPPGFRLRRSRPRDVPLPDPEDRVDLQPLNANVERRQMRMNKNRESAARSRARRRVNLLLS